MQEYWTQPATYDPLEFDTRFRPEMLDLWLPHFVECAGLAAQQRIVDLGCGTGGFARALAQRLQAEVIGVDVAVHLLRHAAHCAGVGCQGRAVDRSETACPHHRSEIGGNASSNRSA